MSRPDPIFIDVLTLVVSAALVVLTIRWSRSGTREAGRWPVLVCAGLLMGLLGLRLGFFPQGGSSRSIWRSAGFHLFLWWALLSVVPWLAVLAVGPARRPGVRAFLERPGRTWLLALVWLHGVLFNPPNNWATIDRYGFFGFWFKPHRSHELAEHPGLLILLALPAVVLALLAWERRARRAPATDGGWSRPFLAHALVVLAALLLRPIPDATMDAAMHMSYVFRHPQELLSHLGPVIVVCGLLGGGLLVAAHRIARPGPAAAPGPGGQDSDQGPRTDPARQARSAAVLLRGLPADADEAALRKFAERHGSLASLEIRAQGDEREAVLRMKNARHAAWLLEGLAQETPFGPELRAEAAPEA